MNDYPIKVGSMLFTMVDPEPGHLHGARGRRHDLGDGLAENFQGAGTQGNREFMTAELWGVADTGPYLHDGRALTLNAAILAHGGEAQSARDRYATSSEQQKNDLLTFLHSLRAPVSPNADVLLDAD